MFFAVFFLFLPYMAFGNEDIPCNKVRAQYGYICACNSTYCDTINPPKKLSAGEYHFYSTSYYNPGFNYKKGNFKIQAFSPEGFRYEVNKTSRFQKIRGFGGSFTDSFGYVLNDLTADTREKLLKSFFAEDGIEYTTCRVVIGSSDFSLRSYTYVPNYDPSMKSFNLTEDDFIYKIRHMKKAMNMSRHHINFLGSTWNAPEWMKRKGSTDTDYLKPEFRQLWADYFVKTLDAFRSEGIEFWALTTGNEPITLYSIAVGDILIMFPEEQREWIVNNIGLALDKANYTTKLVVLDDMRWFALWWMNTIMRDKRSERYVLGVGLHYYVDVFASEVTLDILHKKYPNQEIIYTESSVNIMMSFLDENNTDASKISYSPQNDQSRGGPHLGSWNRAAYYAQNIIENLNHWATTYIDWNLGLNEEGGPNLGNFPCDASIIMNQTNKNEFYKQPMFYVMGHFSKFIQPDSVIIGVNFINTTQYQYSAVFPSVSESTTTMRPYPSVPPFSNDVQHVGALNPDGSISIVFYNPKSSPAEIEVYDPERGYAFLNLEAKSLSTLVYW